MQENVLINLHGHTHNASGQSWLGKLRVVNPGSVRCVNAALPPSLCVCPSCSHELRMPALRHRYGGNYGSLTLRRRSVGDPWYVESVELRKL